MITQNFLFDAVDNAKETINDLAMMDDTPATLAPEVTDSERIKAAILALTPEQVARVYSGKPGCGCGCRGQYRANPAFAKVDDTVNMTQVKRVLAKVQEAARNGEVGLSADVAYGIYAYETETRYLWIYTTNN